jgi:predicted PurR-regulated permease PerM
VSSEPRNTLPPSEPPAPPPSSSPAAGQAVWNPRITLRAAVFIFFLWVAHAWLVPIALGGVFAVLLIPWNHKLSGKRRNHGPLILTLASFLVVILPLATISVAAVSSLAEFLQANPAGAEDVERTAFRKMMPMLRELNIGSTSARSIFNDLFEKLSSYATGLITGIAAAIPNFIIQGFLFLVSLFYFLRDGEAVASWLKTFLPFRRSETDELFASVRDTIHGAMLGTIATAVVQGGLVLIAFLALQVPGAFLFAVIAAILSFTPILGTAPVTLSGMLYLVLEERWVAAGVMFAAALLIGASDNVVRPWVTSSKGNLHPLLGLLGIFGGITVFGPFGIFLGPVTAAMAVWTLDTYGNLRRAQAERAASDSNT